uniref:Uncharacterized protein n=1 Tax=Toxoplasma gondii COUG TaxID=1074873 RepID=A0A2G8YCC0_TOXGO|nr:hypothetical protein TGCOUG_217380 [Toxoplasma gondii COUG]
MATPHHPVNDGSVEPPNPNAGLLCGPSNATDYGKTESSLDQGQLSSAKATSFLGVSGGNGGNGANTDSSAAAAPLISSHMEEAIDLFLEEGKLLEDLDRVHVTEIYSTFKDQTNARPGCTTMGSSRVPIFSPFEGSTRAQSMSEGIPRRSRETVVGRDMDGYKEGSSISTASSRRTVVSPAALVVAGGSPGEARFMLPSSGVGAYNSISLTKVQPTADKQHVLLTALEWERFRRIVTNLLSTNIDLRSKLRSSQQQFRQLGYTESLEQTVARLKCEELQLRRAIATREACFAGNYSLRAKISACRTGLDGFQDPLQKYQSQLQSLRDLARVLGESVNQMKDRRKQMTATNESLMTVPQTVSVDSQQSGTRWICPQGCAGVLKEIRVAGGRCFVVTIHVRYPSHMESKRGIESSTPRSSTPTSCLDGSNKNSAKVPPMADTFREFDGASVKHRIGLCPSGEATGVVENCKQTASEFVFTGESPHAAASNCPKTLEDLHRYFWARELAEMISNKRAEVIIVVYDTMTSNVHIQTLNMREWPENITREFVHGIVLHISSNLHVQSICASERGQVPPADSSLPTTPEKGKSVGLTSKDAITLQYKKPVNSGGLRETVIQGHVDESFFEEMSEFLVYSGYHEISGVADLAKEPTYFFVCIYQHSERLLVARLFSPRSSQLLVLWIDVVHAKTEYMKLLESKGSAGKLSYYRKGPGAVVEAECKMEDENLLLSADLIRFIVSRLSYENGRLFLVHVTEKNDTRYSPHQSNLQSEGNLLPVALNSPSHSVEMDGQLKRMPPHCRQRVFEALSVAETTLRGHTTITFRHPQLVERVVDESGSSGRSSFVLVQSRVSLLPLEESVSFVVYDPATAWIAESSFHLLDGVVVVQSRQRTFLQKLSLTQTLLDQLFEELSASAVAGSKNMRTDRATLCQYGDGPPRSIADKSAAAEIQENDQTELQTYHDIGGGSSGAELFPTAGEGARKYIASDDKYREKDEAPVDQNARAVAALSRLQWMALLQEIYRDMKLTNNSLVLPGVTLGRVTAYL